MSARKRQRGMTLLEAIFSVLVLATGVVAVFGMITRISTANRSMAFQTSALDAFAEVAAQIKDARCNYPAAAPAIGNTADLTDPVIIQLLGAPGTWYNGTPAIAGSTIERLGDSAPGVVPAVRVDVRARADAVGVNAPPSISFQVRVREIKNDAAMDAVALENGYWIQVFPVTKVCNPRGDATARGEYQ
jgi:Tfp pilus assembly protein PilV